MWALNDIAKFVSFVFLFGGSTYFGYMGRPTEMGLAIIAGALGLAFANIDRISEFRGGGFVARMRNIVEPMVAKETEPQPAPTSGEIAAVPVIRNESTIRILKALGNSRYTWRYISGLAEDTQFSRATIKRAIHSLMDSGLIVATEGANGTVWGLTENGRAVLQRIEAAETQNA